MDTQPQKALQLTKTYIDRRTRNDTRAVLNLVSDTITLETMFTTIRGKQAFADYLDRNHARGEWTEPVTNEKDGQFDVQITGLVKIGFLPIHLITRFFFEEGQNGLVISRIVLGRR